MLLVLGTKCIDLLHDRENIILRPNIPFSKLPVVIFQWQAFLNIPMNGIRHKRRGICRADERLQLFKNAFALRLCSYMFF
jgi:hypothetical protein